MERPNPKQNVSIPLVAGIIAAALAVVLAGGYFGMCAWVQGNGRLLPGAVAVDSQGETVADLSKLSQEEAASAMSQAMDAHLQQRTLTIAYGEGKTAVLSGELLACSPETAVAGAMAAKAEQPFWKLAALWLGLAEAPTDLSLSASAFTPEGEAQARLLTQQIARDLYVAPTDFTYEVGEESVDVVLGMDGQQVDADALLDAIEEALALGKTRLTVEPETVPGKPLNGEVLNELVYVEPKAPGLDENGKLAPAVIGLGVDPAEADAILSETAPGEACTVPLIFTPPDTPVDESLYYHDLLAEVTTYLDGVATRSFNVARAASFCNGVVLQPGDVFSYLGTIGDPSSANGYKPSTGYQNGQTVPMDGGGVCQVSSCLYY